MKQRISAIFAAICVLLTLLPAAASGTGIQSRSKEEIRARWQELKPSWTHSAFVSRPADRAPYTPGEVQPQLLKDALNLTNFMRYLAGLPDDLTLDEALTRQAQQGAVLLSAMERQTGESGYLTHTPDQPSDMPDAFFENGYASTSSSNLYWQLGYDQAATVPLSIMAYLSDTDSHNIARVGHRRWVLNPPLKKTGYGLAANYSVMQVFDESRPEDVSYSHIGWPAAGYFPNDFFSGTDAWSVTLNPSLYDRRRTDEIRVTLTRQSDNRQWQFDNSMKDVSGRYMNIDTQFIGVPFCVIFRPEGLETYADGDTWRVDITGLRKVADGSAASLSYATRFYDFATHLYLFMDSPDYYDEQGNPSELDPGRSTTPLLVDGRALVPVSSLIRALGGTVTYDAPASRVTATLRGHEVQVQLASRNALVDGKPVTLDVAPALIHSRTMLPVSFLVRSLGGSVIWDETLQRITLEFLN